MALQLNNTLRTAIAQMVADAVDAGTANPAGQLVFLTAGDAVVSTIVFNNPAFGAPSNGDVSLIVSPVVQDSSAVGGTPTKFEIQDRDGNVVLEGTVGASGTEDIVLASPTIGIGETVKIDSLTYSAPDAP